MYRKQNSLLMVAMAKRSSLRAVGLLGPVVLANA